MTYNEIINIAKRLDESVQRRIDKDVEKRLEILRQGDLNEEDMNKMEECLYISLVLQEYLSGEYELLDEEKSLLFAEMEEMYNEYGELLTKAKLEEKVSKKKRMALELMRIREELFDYKERYKDVNDRIKENRSSNDKLKELSSEDKMKEITKEVNKEKAQVMGKNKDELPNPDKMNWGMDSARKSSKASSSRNKNNRDYDQDTGINRLKDTDRYDNNKKPDNKLTNGNAIEDVVNSIDALVDESPSNGIINDPVMGVYEIEQRKLGR